MVSETFILRQITGLLDLGHEVEIFSSSQAETDVPLHPEVTTHHLLERTTYIDASPESSVWEMRIWPLRGRTWVPGAPRGTLNLVRMVRALPMMASCLTAAPRLARQTFTNLAGNGSAASVTDSTPTDSQRHYRVVAQ